MEESLLSMYQKIFIWFGPLSSETNRTRIFITPIMTLSLLCHSSTPDIIQFDSTGLASKIKKKICIISFVNWQNKICLHTTIHAKEKMLISTSKSLGQQEISEILSLTLPVPSHRRNPNLNIIAPQTQKKQPSRLTVNRLRP